MWSVQLKICIRILSMGRFQQWDSQTHFALRQFFCYRHIVLYKSCILLYWHSDFFTLDWISNERLPECSRGLLCIHLCDWHKGLMQKIISEILLVDALVYCRYLWHIWLHKFWATFHCSVPHTKCVFTRNYNISNHKIERLPFIKNLQIGLGRIFLSVGSFTSPSSRSSSWNRPQK